jgi:isoprenylcysteine carboxyl methyltransferase (ICMT) family protein
VIFQFSLSASPGRAVQHERNPPHDLQIGHWRLVGLSFIFGRRLSREFALDRLNPFNDGPLGGAAALGGERDLAAQHGLDRRKGESLVSPDRDRPIGLFESELDCPPGRHATGPPARIAGAFLEGVALLLFGLAWIVILWAMYVNRFFSSIPRIQSERGHVVITTGPYRFVRHPGYTAALVAAVTSGIALGSWISTFVAPVALVLLVWRTIVEDRMLQRDLPGYADYAARSRYRLVPGIW